MIFWSLQVLKKNKLRSCGTDNAKAKDACSVFFMLRYFGGKLRIKFLEVLIYQISKAEKFGVFLVFLILYFILLLLHC